MSSNTAFIIGAGTYGEAMHELAQICGYEILGYYDEDETKKGTKVFDSTVIGRFSDLNNDRITGNNFIVAIGDNLARYRIMSQINSLNGITPTLIHPSAIISPSAVIGRGVYIQPNACVWTRAAIGDYCIISPNVVIAHHSHIGKACLISTLSGIGASITIEDQVFIGMGSTIVTGISCVGRNSVIGAGAVVLKDIERNSVYVGVPARKIREL